MTLLHLYPYEPWKYEPPEVGIRALIKKQRFACNPLVDAVKFVNELWPGGMGEVGALTKNNSIVSVQTSSQVYFLYAATFLHSVILRSALT